MYNLLCISNRHLCTDNFTARIRNIADRGIPVILREKDLTEREYFELLTAIDRKSIIAHSFIHAAREFGSTAIHLPLPQLETADTTSFATIGASTHSVEQAQRAEALGASYVTAGHVFATDCKKGLAPHGVGLIREITAAIQLPVYGLGGIDAANAGQVMNAGAAGIAVMSGFMQCADIDKYIDTLQKGMIQ